MAKSLWKKVRVCVGVALFFLSVSEDNWFMVVFFYVVATFFFFGSILEYLDLIEVKMKFFRLCIWFNGWLT